MRKNRMRLTESQLHRVIKESVKRVLNEVAIGGASLHGTNPEDWAALGDLQAARGWKRGEDGDYRGRDKDFEHSEMSRKKAHEMLPPIDLREFDKYIGDDGCYHFPDESTRNRFWEKSMSNNHVFKKGRVKSRFIGNNIGLGDYMD